MAIVKYPGGKEQEIPILKQFFPENIDTYYEPFVGGGSVYLNIKAKSYKINDASEDLIGLYRCIQLQDKEFFDALYTLDHVWFALDKYLDEDEQKDDSVISIYADYKQGKTNEDELKEQIQNYSQTHSKAFKGLISDLRVGFECLFQQEWERLAYAKMTRMKALELKGSPLKQEDVKVNLLGCFKAAVYMYIRYWYNHSWHFTTGFKSAIYLFIRDMCYSSMFRFNSNGEFNVPYGGITYNKKGYQSTIKKYEDETLLNRLKNTLICCQDYKKFIQDNTPDYTDFMFVDPPYDSEFSTYDQNSFTENSQKELANFLIKECKCKFILDIKYTDFIASLYQEGMQCANHEKLRIITFDKKYSVSFMNRNQKSTEHMLIMNYTK